jgi:hypothetical protein
MGHSHILAMCLCLGVSISPAQVLRNTRTILGGRATVETRVLDANHLWLAVSDRGYLNFDFPGWNSGCKWWDSAGYVHAVVYDQGPWIIGKVNEAPAAAATLWRSSYSPGPIIGGRPALDVVPGDSIRYHPYKINIAGNSQDSDYVNWPADLAAPVDALGKPIVSADQMIWSVFNGADTTVFPDGWGVDQTSRQKLQFRRLPVEIRQSVYAHLASSATDTSLLANAVFQEWTFINKSPVSIESCYVGLWADIDIGVPPVGDFTAVDTTLSLGYLWVSDNSGYEPFAVGYTMLYGPAVPSPGGTAVYRGRMRVDYRNLPLSAFLGISQNWGVDSILGSAPNTIVAAWNVARGFDKQGNVIIDSASHLPTHFTFSGDPVTGSGWIDTRYNPAQAGILMFSGPFNLAPGDTQWMMSALVQADAGDPMASIIRLRNMTSRLRLMPYDEIAGEKPSSVSTPESLLPRSTKLFQNYPNPFNPSTTIRYGLPHRSHVLLTVYNTLGQKVAELVDQDIDAGYHEVQFDGRKLASGAYFYRLQAGDFFQTRKLLLLK